LNARSTSRNSLTSARQKPLSLQQHSRRTQHVNQEIIMLQSPATTAAASHEIRFQSLFKPGRALTFPCDPEGHVDLDHAGERLRNNYLYARAMLGREYAMPVVLRSDMH
jgi:hypothetical protein